MKVLVAALMLIPTLSWSREIGDFNHILMQNIQRDIANQNDQNLRIKSTVNRGPASVESDESGRHIKEVPKFEKMNVRQIGASRW